MGFFTKKRNDYYPFGQLLPNRHGSTDSYRYGFQGQEKDDEVKGEGNSINYKYRMHDPRVGRFFATDPLTSKYPWYSPYQFSGNKVIQFVELEGLEEGLTRHSYVSGYLYADGQITDEEFFEIQKTRAVGTVIGLIAAGDIALTKGQVSKFLLKQYGFNVAINSTVNYLTDDNSWSVFEETLKEFDFADAGIDKGFDLVLDKYKIGKLKDVLKITSSAFIDVSYNADGFEVKSWKEGSDEIIGNIIINVLGSAVDNSVGKNENGIPVLKLNKKAVDQIVDIFKESTGQVVVKEGSKIIDKAIESNEGGSNFFVEWFNRQMEGLNEKIKESLKNDEDNNSND